MCNIIVQNKKKIKTERKSADDFYSLSQVSNDINDN